LHKAEVAAAEALAAAQDCPSKFEEVGCGRRLSYKIAPQ
jgi:hypothetical protein